MACPPRGSQQRKAGSEQPKGEQDMTQRQEGSLFASNGAWFVRYRERTQQPDGTTKSVQRAHRLASVKDFPKRSEVTALKHEFMAMMLEVTRSVVTRAAGRLQNEKMIRYTRGQMTILDRSRLEATACECYGTVKAQYDHMASMKRGQKQ